MKTQVAENYANAIPWRGAFEHDKVSGIAFAEKCDKRGACLLCIPLNAFPLPQNVQMT